MVQEEVIEKIIERLNNASCIIKDNYSFLFLRSAYPSKLKEYNLGDGALSSAIALFALLNLISKVFYILNKGDSKIVSEEDVKKYCDLKSAVQKSNPECWSKISQYFKKPRIGDINETEAFIFLIKQCDLDFGIDKNNRAEIQSIWENYRNNLTHMITLSGDRISGQMLTTLINDIDNEGNFLVIQALIRDSIEYTKPFETKKSSVSTSTNNLEKETGNTQRNMYQQCYTDRLNILCERIIEWLISKVYEKKFPVENYIVLLKWFDSQLE